MINNHRDNLFTEAVKIAAIQDIIRLAETAFHEFIANHKQPEKTNIPELF